MSIKVLVVEDSTFSQQILTQMLNADSEIEVVGTASDGKEALDKLVQLKPDVVTLDIEMPKMDGLECLAKIMEIHPVPVIMVSYLTTTGAEPTIRALELGAVDFVTKISDESDSLANIRQELLQKVKIAATINVTKLKTTDVYPPTFKKQEPAKTKEGSDQLEMLSICSSTGGPRALYKLLTLFPKSFPLGIVVAQHMPKDFTKVFAQRLDDLCPLEVSEAKTGDLVKPGRILIAPSGRQTKILRNKLGLVVEVTDEPNLIYKPSFDYFLKSLAITCKGKVLSIILTGMGSDGAVGMQELRSLGGRTIAEAEESCVVFGMPRATIELGGAEYVENLPQIFPRILKILSEYK